MKQSGLGACAPGLFSLLFFQRGESFTTPPSHEHLRQLRGPLGQALLG
jgi:hypothetical protein